MFEQTNSILHSMGTLIRYTLKLITAPKEFFTLLAKTYSELNQGEKLTPKTAFLLTCPISWIPCSILPALFGILYSMQEGFHMSLLQTLNLMLICILMHSSVNTLNTTFDYIRGNDTFQDNSNPEISVLLYHRVKPLHAFALGIFFILFAACAGIPVVINHGVAPLVVGVIGGVTVLLYSGGPVSISHLPAGEIVSGIVMGMFIPMGITAAASSGLYWPTLYMSLPFAIGIALLMMANNCCDIEKDIRVGRHTLPIELGRNNTVKLYRICSMLWIISAIICSLSISVISCAVTVIIIVLQWKPIMATFKSTLTQETRIDDIGYIMISNITINGAYVLAVLAGLLTGFHD